MIETVFKLDILEKVPLSIAILTKNEEENIRQFLQGVAFVGQFVVDSGSTDVTLRIASEFNYESYSEEWCGLGIHIF